MGHPTRGSADAGNELMADLDLIARDPSILGGKPVVRGTRLSVELLLGLFGDGWTQEQVLEEYPALTPEALRAVFAYAADVLAKQPLAPVRTHR
jgi:uncharacterized protein (DUF433 family)